MGNNIKMKEKYFCKKCGKRIQPRLCSSHTCLIYQNNISKLNNRIKKLKKKIREFNKFKKIKDLHETNGDYLTVFLAGMANSRNSLRISKEKRKRKYHYRLQVYLSFRDKEDAKLFQDNVGGNLNEDGRQNKTHKAFEWKIRGTSSVMNFLEIIGPYITNKNFKKRIKIAKRFVDYQDRHFGEKGKASLKNAKYKEKLYQQMRRLNPRQCLEPEIRPEFVKEMRKIEKGKHYGFKDISDLRKQIEG